MRTPLSPSSVARPGGVCRPVPHVPTSLACSRGLRACMPTRRYHRGWCSTHVHDGGAMSHVMYYANETWACKGYVPLRVLSLAGPMANRLQGQSISQLTQACTLPCHSWLAPHEATASCSRQDCTVPRVLSPGVCASGCHTHVGSLPYAPGISPVFPAGM